MNEEKKHSIYTAADINRYLTGAMAAAEMQAIEMAALDDPLLAEAIEGYEAMEQKDWSKELAALKNQLTSNENTPVIPIASAPALKWWRAAAAILVAGCTVAAAYIFTTKNPTEQKAIAAINLQNDSTVIALADSVSSFQYKSADTVTTTVVTTGVGSLDYNATTTVDNGNYLATVENKPKTDSSFVYQPSPASTYQVTLNDDVAVNTEQDLDKKSNAEIAANVTSPAVGNNAAPNAAYTQKNEATLDNGAFVQNKDMDKYRANNNINTQKAGLTYFGQVVTPDNSPLGFANVITPENKKPIYTDANGRFQFKSFDTAVKITVSSPGYNAMKFTLQNSITQGFQNTIVLQPQDIETAKITLSKRKALVQKIPTLAADSTEEDEEAAPSGGWVAYNNYLNNNLVLPGEAKSGNIHGEVEVYVQLKTNGDISQVKIAKPLCSACDAEALRLIKEGPKFEVKSKKNKQVKVKVKF